MKPQHERAVQKLVEHFAPDETCLGVIVGGSVAKGLAKNDSDIDVVLVVSDDLYRKKLEENMLLYFNVEFCDYPGGYIDGKIVNLDYIRAAAERANEPTRAAFSAVVVHSKVPGLEDLVRQIPVYQPQEQRDKVQAFYAQFEIAHWYVSEALKRNDAYMLHHAVADLVLYGARLILAHNEVLYPYHKFLMMELERAPEKPDSLMALIDALLADHTLENARAFYDAVKDFRFWNEAWEMPAMRFMKDTELAWLDRRAYVGDL
jgi:predicted nucleotidyltransferase